jgi:hypothetical protein
MGAWKTTKSKQMAQDQNAVLISEDEWLESLNSEINAPHELIYMNISDEICLKQIAKRSIEQPERASFDTEEVFHHVTSFLENQVQMKVLISNELSGAYN